MSDKSKEMAVLSILRQKDEAWSLSEIMQILGSDVTERTVRRWLLKLAQEGLVEIHGAKKGTRYRAIGEWETPRGFSAKSAKVIAYVRQPLSKRKPVAYDEDDYNSALLAVYELQDIGPLLDLFVFSYLRTCDTYKATVEALGFDLVRVKYRQERREMLRYIIERQLVGVDLRDYIYMQIKNFVEEKDRADFLDDIQEDLKGLNPQRIAGLGITLEQFTAWKKRITL
jgi:hypothetical protein